MVASERRVGLKKRRVEEEMTVSKQPQVEHKALEKMFQNPHLVSCHKKPVAERKASHSGIRSA